MTDNPTTQPVDPTEALDWDNDELGSMADYADDTEPELEK